MKNVLNTIICVALIATLCLFFASCSYAKTTNNIVFNEKYAVNGNEDGNFYVFYSDNTGIYECHYSYDASVDSSYHYTLSGTVEFEWREASDGGIYLFKTDVHYNDDHTEGKTISIISTPIYFSKDFFVSTGFNQYGDYSERYIRVGSELDEILEK